MPQKGVAAIDWSVVIVAVLALVGSVCGTVIPNRKNAALISYRMEQLEKKVQAHNNLVERMYAVEEENRVQGVEMASLKERIGRLDSQ